MKKAQAAFEFLTTYGWAFIVILIMIGALTSFGVLKPSKLLPDRCNFGAEIGCVDYKISASDNTFDIRLKNNMGIPIVVEKIELSSDTPTPYDCDLDKPSLDYTWSTETTDFSFTKCNSKDAGMVIGEKGKVFITITYYSIKSGSTYTHKVNGEVFSTVV